MTRKEARLIAYIEKTTSKNWKSISTKRCWPHRGAHCWKEHNNKSQDWNWFAYCDIFITCGGGGMWVFRGNDTITKRILDNRDSNRQRICVLPSDVKQEAIIIVRQRLPSRILSLAFFAIDLKLSHKRIVILKLLDRPKRKWILCKWAILTFGKTKTQIVLNYFLHNELSTKEAQASS